MFFWSKTSDLIINLWISELVSDSYLKYFRSDPERLAHGLEELSAKKEPKKISEVVGMNRPAPKPKAKHESWAQYMQGKKKQLSAIMKTELLKDKTSVEIKAVHSNYSFVQNRDDM